MTDLSLNASNVLILGKKQSGKTNLIKHLIKNSFKETDTGLIFNDGEKYRNNYENLYSVCNVHSEYNSEAVNNYVNEKSKGICLGGKPNEKKTFIIFDDILYSTQLWNENKQDLLELIYNGRYYNSLNIFSFQCKTTLPKNIYDNFDYIFLFKTNLNSEKHKLYKLLEKVLTKSDEKVSSFENFEKLLDSLKNFESLVIDVNENKLFLYKCKYENQKEKEIQEKTQEEKVIENKTDIDFLKSLFW